jgi:hypothetical protein
MTADTLKQFFASPLALFAVMLLSSVANGLKQLIVVKQTGHSMTFWEYWGYVPETLVTLISNGLAFVVLLMSDQLNIASAASVGYGLNSLSDLLPRGRSYALKQTPDDPNKTVPKS